MKIIRNPFIPFPGFAAINLFGVLFIRSNVQVTERLLNHERIHTAQMKELGYIFFYIIYVLEWLVRLFLPGNAYRNISFEQEADLFEVSKTYLNTRKRFAMWNH